MARNCSKCGDTTCNCAIIEGAGTNITGIGSGASPYIIEADLVTVDTTSVDLSGNGGPTPLSAVVKVDPARSITISGTGIGVDECALTSGLNNVVSGQVLVKGTSPDCLAFLNPSVAGKAIVSDGTEFVLGDAASPNVIDYVDSVTGLPQGYGIIDSSNGTEKYYDLDGNIVASRPAEWVPQCCEGGGVSPDYLPMQQAASVLGITHVALGTFVGTPSGTLTFVNTSATRNMEVIIQMGTNFEISVPDTFWATDRFITELSVNGGAYATVYNQQILAGGTYPGNTVGVQNSVSIDRLSALTVLPGATLTLNIRSTTTILQRTTLAGSVSNNTVLKAWGHYI